MDFFKGFDSETLALVDQVRSSARNMAITEWLKDLADETVRRTNALGFWRRLYVNTTARCWSTAAVVLRNLSGTFPGLRGPSNIAASRMLRPPSLYPELGSATRVVGNQSGGDSGARKAAAVQALAEGIQALAAAGELKLSVERTLQLEELSRWVEMGADEVEIRDAFRRIAAGETFVATLKRAVSGAYPFRFTPSTPDKGRS